VEGYVFPEQAILWWPGEEAFQPGFFFPFSRRSRQGRKAEVVFAPGLFLLSLGGARCPARRCKACQSIEIFPPRAQESGTVGAEIGGMEQQNDRKLVATASTSIHAPVAKVWDALVNPRVIKQYMFGTNVVSDFREGSPITWKGEWKGKPYEDKGEILKLEPERLLRYSHYSPLSGQPDTPESRHTVTIELSGNNGQTGVKLSQDNNLTDEERQHSQQNWEGMLKGLKELLEKA
jgi:uncharacterized protein YndB with AHSA1/START domain